MTLPGNTRFLTLLTALLIVLAAGCAPVEPPVELTVEVQDAINNQAIAAAEVKGEVGLRYAVEGVTDSNGSVTLTYDPVSLELHNWTKLTVTATDYVTKTLLAQVEAGSPPTVVELLPVGAEPPAPESEQPPPAEASPTAEPAAAEANPDAAPPPGPLADVPPAERANTYSSRPDMTIDPAANYSAIIQTSKGDIEVSLNAAAAPEHVNNFVFLANQGFYDGLTFHRVEPGFVIQGGDPQGSGEGGPGYTIPGEFSLKHGEGALAMARLGDAINPDRESSGSQFYITLAPTPFLDDQYSVFGQVEAGMDVVNSIEVGDTIERIIIQQN
jgi:cyclophilin family peptidyl-prolyl cis-trans isomerase/cell division septation protein DedD